MISSKKATKWGVFEFDFFFCHTLVQMKRDPFAGILIMTREQVRDYFSQFPIFYFLVLGGTGWTAHALQKLSVIQISRAHILKLALWCREDGYVFWHVPSFLKMWFSNTKLQGLHGLTGLVRPARQAFFVCLFVCCFQKKNPILVYGSFSFIKL